MKKLFVTIGLWVASMTISPPVFADDPDPNPIHFVLGKPEINPETDRPRTPILVPQVAQNGHTLFFSDEMDFFVNFYSIDENGVRTLEYATFVSAETDSIVLPPSLMGTYAIEVVQGDRHFWGVIEL
jgi:hypothetical protein